MSKKASSTKIGLFMIIGLGLLIAGLLVFSSRSLFHPQREFILYFNASLKGLNPGAPVKVHGVTIGSVKEILIRHNQGQDDHSMPVIVTIDLKLAQKKSDELLRIGERSKINWLIQKGFRGRLDSESLVTGVLYVEMEFVPEAPPPVFHQITPEYVEIPTVPSQVQQLLADLAKINLADLSAKLRGVLDRANVMLGQVDVPAINAGVTNLLVSANRVVTKPDLTNAITSLKTSLDQARTLLKRVDGRVDPLVDSATNTLHAAQNTLADLRVAINRVSGLIGPDSAIPSDLKQALEDLANASRAVADLAEFLKRDPNSLLTGVKHPKE